MIKRFILLILFLTNTSFGIDSFKNEFIRARKLMSSLPPYNETLSKTNYLERMLLCERRSHRVLSYATHSLGQRRFESFGSLIQAQNYSGISFVQDFFPIKDSMELLGESFNKKIYEVIRLARDGSIMIEESFKDLEELKNLPLMFAPIYTPDEAIEYIKEFGFKSRVFFKNGQRPWVISISKCWEKD